jgi:hypothetical protein
MKACLVVFVGLLALAATPALADPAGSHNQPPLSLTLR